jgi:hypothetical protein
MSRADEMTTERRRRKGDSLRGIRRRLAITGELDHENYAYRWANDDGARLHQLTVADDWEVVQDRKGTLSVNGNGVGAEVSQPVGVGEQGRPMRAVLLRKPKHLYDEDFREAQSRIDETEAAIQRGANPDGSERDKHMTGAPVINTRSEP